MRSSEAEGEKASWVEAPPMSRKPNVGEWWAMSTGVMEEEEESGGAEANGARGSRLVLDDNDVPELDIDEGEGA